MEPDLAIRRWVCLLLATWPAGAAHADSHCISNELRCGSQTSASTAPAQSLDCYLQFSHGITGYDIPAGALTAGTYQGEASGLHASATMADSFQVVGLAEGEPLDFTAQLSLVGAVRSGVECCFGYARAQIREGSSNTAVINFNANHPAIRTTLELQVRRSAGERFRLSAFVYGAGVEGGSGELRGVLRFSGLPPGASLVSCNGFQQDFPVPVSTGSWGRLKTRYR